MDVYVLIDEEAHLGFVSISNFTAFPLSSCSLTIVQSLEQLLSMV